jgi:fatty-acyl-CoA synthase
MAGQTWTYAAVQRLSWRVGRALERSGIRPGDKVAILSGNDPVAFSCVFGISRAGAVWCPVNPRSEAAENRELLDLLDCRCLIFAPAFAPLVAKIAPDLLKLSVLVCLSAGDGGGVTGATGFDAWLAGLPEDPWQADPVDDIVMIAGTGGTTGKPKGVQLTGHNIEAMTALTLMSYPFDGRPAYLALAPLTHAAGVLCFPVMALGGEVVIMPAPDLGEFLQLVRRHQVTHAFLPPTLIYLLLDHPALPAADLSSLQCLWYGAAPMSVDRLEQAITRIGPVMGQLFGQTEAPMMISTLAPAAHLHPDGTLARERFASAGRPTPLTTVAIMAEDGTLVPPGERRARPAGHGRVLQGSRGDRRGIPARLAPHRRCRLPRQGPLPLHRGPAQGHDHHRRVQRLLRRGRAGPDDPPGGPRLRRGRTTRPQVGGAGDCRGSGPPWPGGGAG